MGTEVQSRPPQTAEVDPWFYGWRYVTRRREDGTKEVDQVPLTGEDVLHPQEGDFIVHTDFHDLLCTYLRSVFAWRLRDRPGARVLGDHRIDWQTGGVKPHGPDVVVFQDSPAWDPHRGTYPVRDQGARPVLVLEVTSPSTRDKDLNQKVAEYCLAEIPRYVIVDAHEGELGPAIRFLDYRHSPDGPVEVPPPDPDRLWLPELDLWLAIDGDRVVCQEPDGSRIGDYTEVASAAAQAEARAEAAQRKVAELEAELRRLRGDR